MSHDPMTKNETCRKLTWRAHYALMCILAQSISTSKAITPILSSSLLIAYQTLNHQRFSPYLRFAEGAPVESEPKFNPFTGVARRLDGKPLTYQPPPVSSPGSKDKQPTSANGTGQPSAESGAQIAARQSQGKLVFGSNASRGPKETQKPEAGKEKKLEQPEKKEEPKFQAFTGKKYSLKG